MAKKKILILTQWSDKSKAKKICIRSLKLRETGKIQFRFHIKPLMVRKQEKRKKPLILIEHHAGFFFNFIYNFGGIFLYSWKKGDILTLRQNSNHLLKRSLFLNQDLKNRIL